jgi:hypothetical protein
VAHILGERGQELVEKLDALEKQSSRRFCRVEHCFMLCELQAAVENIAVAIETGGGRTCGMGLLLIPRPRLTTGTIYALVQLLRVQGKGFDDSVRLFALHHTRNETHSCASQLLTSSVEHRTGDMDR